MATHGDASQFGTPVPCHLPIIRQRAFNGSTGALRTDSVSLLAGVVVRAHQGESRLPWHCAAHTVVYYSPWKSRMHNAHFGSCAACAPRITPCPFPLDLQIEVLLDGASTWESVPVNGTYALADLQDGDHTLVARSRCMLCGPVGAPEHRLWKHTADGPAPRVTCAVCCTCPALSPQEASL